MFVENKKLTTEKVTEHLVSNRPAKVPKVDTVIPAYKRTAHN